MGLSLVSPGGGAGAGRFRNAAGGGASRFSHTTSSVVTSGLSAAFSASRAFQMACREGTRGME